MSDWFISDLHWGHKRVAGHRGFFDEDEVLVDPRADGRLDASAGAEAQPDTGAHDDWLRELWRVVKAKDRVFILGDLAMNARHGLESVGALPGIKHFIAGNHDEVHPMHRTAVNKMSRWMQTFASVNQSGRMRIGGREVLLSHFPYLEHEDGTGRRDGSYPQWRLPDLGVPLLHGHTHGPEIAHGREFHVGVDAHRALVPGEQIADWLESL